MHDAQGGPVTHTIQMDAPTGCGMVFLCLWLGGRSRVVGLRKSAGCFWVHWCGLTRANGFGLGSQCGWFSCELTKTGTHLKGVRTLSLGDLLANNLDQLI